MSKRAQILSSAVLVLGMLTAGNSRAGAATLDFDSLAASTNAVPNGYGGLNWSGANVVADADNVFVGSHAVSAPNFVYLYCCGGSDVISVASGTFDLVSGFFGSGLNVSSSYVVTGYLGVNPLYVQTLAVNSTMSLFNLNMVGVDHVVFDSLFSDNLLLDNLTVNVPSAGSSAVPEPASLILLSTGLGLFEARRRRKQLA